MQKLYIATSNAGKLKEMRELAEEYFGFFTDFEGRAAKSADETGKDFIENAEIKSRALETELSAEQPQGSFWVLSDDSGLAVDALNGDPGLHSARYAGDHVDPKLHMEKLLTELGKLKLKPEQRTARYHCALSLIHHSPQGRKEFSGEGLCEGLIVDHPQGSSGFGYDPIFYSPHFKKTLSEVSFVEKNSISHRRNAFEILKPRIEEYRRGARNS